MGEVDLDRLAAAYDHRPSGRSVDRVSQLAAVCDVEPGIGIDVGGGRGAQAAEMSRRSGHCTIVIDPSAAMLASASERGLVAVRGIGERLPVASESAVFVMFHLSIHHGDWRQMLAEAWRVVRPGGIVWIWTMDPELLRSGFLANWFPRIGEIDGARFPQIGALSGELASFGSSPTIVRDIEVIERSAGSWIEAVQAGFVSTLHLLTGDELGRGVRSFEVAHPDPSEAISYSLEHVGVWGTKPPVES